MLTNPVGVAEVGEVLVRDHQPVRTVLDTEVVELEAEFLDGPAAEPDLGHLEVPDRLGFEAVVGSRHRALVAHWPHPSAISGNCSGSWP